MTDRSSTASVCAVPRPRTFSQQQVLRLAVTAFTTGGYEGTSIDDLVQALDLHRGSLYKAFGSKRGLFLAALEDYVRSTLPAVLQRALDGAGNAVDQLTSGGELDLLLVAAVERGASDPQVSALVAQALAQLDRVAAGSGRQASVSGDNGGGATILGIRLRRRLVTTSHHPTTSELQEEGT